MRTGDSRPALGRPELEALRHEEGDQTFENFMARYVPPGIEWEVADNPPDSAEPTEHPKPARQTASAQPEELLDPVDPGQYTETLFEEYRTAIYSYILGETHSPEAAEDITQDVFESVLRDRSKVPRSIKYPAPWLRRVARNKIIDRARRRELINWMSLDIPFEAEGGSTETFEDILPDPEDGEDTATRLANESFLMQALSSLQFEQAQALILYGYFGYSYPRIDELLGLDRDNAKMRAARGKRHIRQLAQSEAFFES